MYMTDELNKNKPEQKLVSGNVSATVWKNTINVKNSDDDSKKVDVYKVTFEKSFKNDDDEWSNTKSFDLNDLFRISTLSNLLIEEHLTRHIYFDE